MQDGATEFTAQKRDAFPVEKGVPIPAQSRGGSRPHNPRAHRYPIYALNVGESFLVPGMEKTAGLGGVLEYAKRKTGNTFTARKVDGGIRVWRTA